MAKLAFVDTETTGLDPDRHQIWDVGLIINGEEREWQLPVDLGRADPFALSIGRFHQRRRLPSQMTSLDTFSQQFAKLTRGAHLVGAVVSFDEERLRKLVRSNGACPEWHYHLIDVENLAVGYLARHAEFHGRDRSVLAPPWDSESLSKQVGVDPEEFERHTALGDARWAKAIYEAVMG